MATLKEIEDAERAKTEISKAGKDAAALLQRVVSGLIASMNPGAASASSKLEQQRLGAFIKEGTKRIDEYIYVDETDRAFTTIRLQVGGRTTHMNLSIHKLDNPMKGVEEEVSFWSVGLLGAQGTFLPENPTNERLKSLYGFISGSMKQEILKKS